MKYIASIVTFLLLLGTTGCDVLDVKPQQSIPAEDAVKDRQSLETAVTGCYDALQSSSYYGRNYIINADLAADLGQAAGTIKEYYDINNNALLADNILVDGMWAAIYDGINRVNNVLYYMPNVTDITEAERNSYTGELRFLRGLMYFDLVRLFGGVPLKELPSLDAGESLNVARSSVSDVYDFIIDDLMFAEDHITNSGRQLASPEAATALLARIYLYREDYQAAIDKAAEVIESGLFSLEGNYDDLYGPGGVSSEAIFQVAFSEQDGTRLAEYFYPNVIGGRREIAPTTKFVEAWDPNDERFDAALQLQEEDYYGYKYRDIGTRSDRVYVIRLAEVYLIRAEAEAQLGNLDNAAGDLNTVRERAVVPPLFYDTKEEMLLAIENERMFELAFEGHRWFDLVRTNRAMEVVSSVTQEYQTLYPIPLSEILTNKAINQGDQNPGY